MMQVYPTMRSLSEAAADLLVQTALESAKSRGQFTVALSGGSTPQFMHSLLAQPPRKEQVPWQKVHVFWGDERCVPAGDPRHNATLTINQFLSAVPVPREQVHPILCDWSPEHAAVEYEKLLRRFFRDGSRSFDLVFLGLGEDGHTASLFPHSPVLEEKGKWVRSVFVADQVMYRVTMTPVLINSAAAIAFLVSGADKADVLRKVIEGPYDPLSLPAQLIRPADGKISWLIDRAAASCLGSDGRCGPF